MKLNILLVDDHRLVADAMAIMLKDLDGDVEVTTCHTSQHALSTIDQNNHFDLILTDMFMPGINGLGFLHGLKNRNITAPIVLVSSTDDIKIARAAIDHGAAGFIQKSIPGAEMLSILRNILNGGSYLPTGFGSLSVREEKQLNGPTSTHENRLGPRQIEVLQLMAAGNSNKQIAQVLEISESTVKYHTSLLFKALSVQNRTSCIREGQRQNLITSGDDFAQ